MEGNVAVLRVPGFGGTVSLALVGTGSSASSVSVARASTGSKQALLKATSHLAPAM